MRKLKQLYILLIFQSPVQRKQQELNLFSFFFNIFPVFSLFTFLLHESVQQLR